MEMFFQSSFKGLIIDHSQDDGRNMADDKSKGSKDDIDRIEEKGQILHDGILFEGCNCNFICTYFE